MYITKIKMKNSLKILLLLLLCLYNADSDSNELTKDILKIHIKKYYNILLNE